MQLQVKFSLAKTVQGATLSWKGNPLTGILMALLLGWLLLDAAVGFDYFRDHYSAYRGEVVGIRNAWYDWVTLGFTPVEHLTILTADGKRQDRLVTQSNRFLNRIEVGDQVVKERGFGNFPQVPDKLTVQQMLEAQYINSQ